MAAPVHRLIQDQNLNFLNNGAAAPVGKTDVAKADKKGGLARRKALNDISNSRKPSVLPSGKKDNATKVTAIKKDPFAIKVKSSKVLEKGKVGGRRALSDLTNSAKPPSKPLPNASTKINAVTEENGPGSFLEEGFLHNHEECIKERKALELKLDCFLELVGLNNDIPGQQQLFQLSPNMPENNTKHFEIEEMPEPLLVDLVFPQSKKLDSPGYSSPACRSPKSPEFLYKNWDIEDYSDLILADTPKLL